MLEYKQTFIKLFGLYNNMYKIKQKPEDFIVKEIPIYELKEGEYSYFWLTKKDYNTVKAVQRIADKLNIRSKKIGFAGTKDKIAITKQIISIRNIDKEKVENLNIKDIKLEYIGNGDIPISLGDLKGNEFVIVVKNLNTNKLKNTNKIPNLFGPQRFSKNNAEIGKELVRKDFKKALNLINNKEVKDYLEINPVDFIGALRKIPLKTRKMYVHAYQSLIWNKTAEKYLEISFKNIKIPLIGFQTEIENLDYDLKEIVLDILNKERLTERDFIIPQVKELTAEGGERDLFITPENFEINFEKKGIKYNAIISFFLPKGSYATIVIDYLFK